jgi:hypothetical protein
MRIPCTLILSALLLPPAADASEVLHGTIANLQINRNYGNLVFIQTNTATSGSAPTCQSSGWQLTQ